MARVIYNFSIFFLHLFFGRYNNTSIYYLYIICHTFRAGPAGSPSLVWPRSRDPHCNRVYLPRRHDVTPPRKSTGRLLLLIHRSIGSTGSLDHWIIGSELQESCQHQYESIISCQLSTATTSAFFCRGGSRRQSVGRIPILTREPVLLHRFQGRQGPISQSNRLEVARLASSHESNLPADFTPKLANLVEKLPFVGRCSCPMEILIFLIPFKIMASSV